MSSSGDEGATPQLYFLWAAIMAGLGVGAYFLMVFVEEQLGGGRPTSFVGILHRIGGRWILAGLCGVTALLCATLGVLKLSERSSGSGKPRRRRRKE